MSRSASTPPSDLRTELLARVPDTPCWVETRGLLLEGARAVGTPEHALVVSDDGLILCVIGQPPELSAEAAAAPVGAALLVQPDQLDWVSAQLPDWTAVRAHVYSLRAPIERDPSIPTRWLTRDDPLPELLPEVHREIDWALAHGLPVATALAAGAPASFCYAWKQSETLFDISIETAAPHRRKGLAGAAAKHLIVEMADQGKRPVWGAAEDNPASMHLASKLGFGAPDDLYVFERAGRSSG